MSFNFLLSFEKLKNVNIYFEKKKKKIIRFFFFFSEHQHIKRKYYF